MNAFHPQELSLQLSLTLRQARRRLIDLRLIAFGLVLAVVLGLSEKGVPVAERENDLFRADAARLLFPLLAVVSVLFFVGTEFPSKQNRAYSRLGSSPVNTSVAAALLTMVLSALTCGIAATLIVVVDGTLPMSERIVCVWAASLAGASSSAMLLFFATFFQGGLGLFIGVVFELFFGWSSGAFAILCPWAHFRHLMGGSPVVGMSQMTSTMTLVVLAGFYLVLAVHRSVSKL